MHINPFVTIALSVIRRLPTKFIGPYIAAQIIGSVIAGLCPYGLHPNAGKAVYFGATFPGTGISDGAAIGYRNSSYNVATVHKMNIAVDKRAHQAGLDLT
ncbi:MAG: aquaporin [Desulfurococcaceae archaeon]